MGPRPIRRGNTILDAAMKSSQAASMGPRPIRRGNITPMSSPDFLMGALQWGHVQSDVETTT